MKLRDAVKLTIGGGWGEDEVFDASTPVTIVRGADFPDVSLGRFDQLPLRFEGERAAAKRKCQAGDILVEVSGGTRDRPTGRSVFVNRELVEAVAGTTVIPASFCRLMRVDPSMVHPRFVYYSLQRFYASGLAWSYQNQSTGISNFQFPRFLSEFELPDFDLATQTAIADVLGALDDKIAANERVVAALDSLVRAVVERGTQGETVRVGDVASLVSLKSNGGGPVVPYLGLEHLPRRRLWAQDSGLSSEVTSQKSVFEEGDLLFGKLRPYFHKVVVAQHAGVCSTDILVVRAIDEELRGWMWAALASDDVVAAVTASSTGTRMPRASWGDLAEVQVPWPGRSEAARVSRQIESLNARAAAAVAESRRLAATRDALLPELISGRLKVKGIAEGARE